MEKRKCCSVGVLEAAVATVKAWVASRWPEAVAEELVKRCSQKFVTQKIAWAPCSLVSFWVYVQWLGRGPHLKSLDKGSLVV